MVNKAKHYTKQWSTKLSTTQSNGQQSKTLHKAMVNKAKHRKLKVQLHEPTRSCILTIGKKNILFYYYLDI